MVFPPRSCNTPASRVLCSARCWPRWVMDWSYPRCRNWGWWWWWWWWWSSDHLIIWRLMIIFMTLIRINVLVAFAPLGPRSSVSPSPATRCRGWSPPGPRWRPPSSWRPLASWQGWRPRRQPPPSIGSFWPTRCGWWPRCWWGSSLEPSVGASWMWLGGFHCFFSWIEICWYPWQWEDEPIYNFRLFFWVLHSSRRFQTRTLALESLLVPRQRGFWCCLPPPCGLLPWARGMRATSWCQWVLQRGPCFNPSSWWSWQARWVCFFWWFLKGQHNNTARRCVLPGKFTWRLSIIFQHAQTPARGQCFEISQTTSPKP